MTSPAPAKLRHIAIAVKNPDKAAKFFEEAFGMTRAGSAQRGVTHHPGECRRQPGEHVGRPLLTDDDAARPAKPCRLERELQEQRIGRQVGRRVASVTCNTSV